MARGVQQLDTSLLDVSSLLPKPIPREGTRNCSYPCNGQEANVVAQELGEEKEVTAGLLLMQLLHLLLHLGQLGERPGQSGVVL